MERKIWKPVINILKEMAPEKNEHLTLIFILNGSQLEKSTLVGCKIKMEVHLFNRDAHEKDTTSKSYWKFVLKCEWFCNHSTVYDNSKLFNFYFKFLVSGPTFYELVTFKSFFIKEIQILSLNIKNSGKGFAWNLRSLYFISHNKQKMSYFAHRWTRLSLLGFEHRFEWNISVLIIQRENERKSAC